MIVDFAYVPANQYDIHDRLLNWAKWAQPGFMKTCSPMFRGYRPYLYPPEGGGGIPIDGRDAMKVQKIMKDLPEKHRCAIQWFYIIRCNPMPICRALGLNKQGLADMVKDGRSMASNLLRASERETA